MSQTIHQDLEFVVGEFRRLLNRLSMSHDIGMVASRTPHGFCLRWGQPAPDPEQTEPSDILPWRKIETLEFPINYGAHRKTDETVWLMDAKGGIKSGRPIKRQPSGMVHVVGIDDFAPAYWQPFVVPAAPLCLTHGEKA